MSRDLYESLFEEDADPAVGSEEEEAVVSPTLRAFARAAARRRAAHDLATEELLDGRHVDEEEPPVEAPVRLAAQDAGERSVYADGPFRVGLRRGPDGLLHVRQLDGPAGATLEVDGRFVPLSPGESAVLGGGPRPDRLKLLDAAGRVWRLVPAD
ncbi:MAG: hypothetical protein H6742_08890 [Alphaproteobacteria bacterium]|nr:hypothetical protein [Alphaproteobacteria bacterium]